MVAIFTSQTPSLGDGDTAVRTLGMRFTISTSGYSVTQGRVWVKTGGLPTITKLWQLWNADTSTKLAEFDLTALGTPTEDAWSPFFNLSSPVALSTGVDYIVAIHQQGDPGYVYSDGVPAPLPIVNGVLTADTGIYQNGGGSNTIPSTTFGGYFFADLNVALAAQDGAVGLATEVDQAFSISIGGLADAAVGLATEVDSALAVAAGSLTNGAVGLATEVDQAFSITASSVANGTVGLATEIDSAFNIVPSQEAVGEIGLAIEVDQAFAFTADSTANGTIGLATEIDQAFSFTPSGSGAIIPSSDYASTFYANQLAGTLVNGVPTLTMHAALCVWAGVSLTLTDVAACNLQASNVMPNWLAIQGVLNELAGTTNLSVHDCLRELAEGL